jgi:hypothetical protein
MVPAIDGIGIAWLWKMAAGSSNIAIMATQVSDDIISELGRRYLWWAPLDGRAHSEDRIIAQTMELGTYDDILLLERTVGRVRLADVMLHAEPGWISKRSWEFWRGRLSAVAGIIIPPEPPRRQFDATTS